MRRSTLIYLVTLIVLAGLYTYLQNRSEPTSDITLEIETAPAVDYLFTAEVGLPSRIRIEAGDGAVVDVERNAENAWVLTQPQKAEADQGSVEAAASQISTIRILDRNLDLAANAVGIDQPAYTLTLQFTSGVERILEIGVLTPTGTGYYVKNDEGEILIVSNSAIDGLIGLLTNPPYAPTATPPPP